MLTCTDAASCATIKLTVAYPLELVCALAALSAAEPLTTVKFTPALLCGMPLLRTRTVSGMAALAPWEIHR